MYTGLPGDPVILLSVVNTKLRDFYPSLEALCEDMQADQKEITDKLKVVLQFIQDHYQKGITVQELADLCHFSEYHFMRFFKRHMNMTSIEYLNQYRLEMASRQLAETNLSVTSIALESGFNNISYFNRVFKRKFGVTPMEYRSYSKSS